MATPHDTWKKLADLLPIDQDGNIVVEWPLSRKPIEVEEARRLRQCEHPQPNYVTVTVVEGHPPNYADLEWEPILVKVTVPEEES